MKKIIVFVGLWLVALNSFAGVCNNASLNGAYNYNIVGMTDSGYAIFDVGRFNFNAKGTGTISGVGSYFGDTTSASGSFTYTVSSGCALSGTITTTNGVKTTFWLYLDRMDAAPAVKLAYHGNLVIKKSDGTSASGTIDRVDGKF